VGCFSKSRELDLKGLQSPDITFWTAWNGETLVATGALKQLSEDHGEVKSMHTVPAARRKGVGSALLRHIISFCAVVGNSGLTTSLLRAAPLPEQDVNILASGNLRVRGD
jgi:GNAT superfamily N-acetyltransferase